MGSYTIKGSASCVWGIDETIEDAGTITDVQYVDTDVSEPCENQEGAVDGVVIYDGNKTAQFTIVAKASATVPEKGGKLTVGTENFLIQTVTTTKAHKGKMRLQVQAIKHDNLVWGA